jgi:hypothetical protein
MDRSEERLRAVEDAVLELLSPRNALAFGVPTLDVTKPNFHDSKSEFRRELEAVETSIESLRKVIGALYPVDRNTDEAAALLLRRVEDAVDNSARRHLLVGTPNTITDLVRKNKADTGFFNHALWCIADMLVLLTERRDELKDQERQYWNKKHRPPNYYARAIALRLARLYAREKGEKPTFGTARDGGYPNTRFGRALERIFEALEITGGVKHPAKWAISQLTDEDLQTIRPNALLGVACPDRVVRFQS